jgi:general secretion pathway protein K
MTQGKYRQTGAVLLLALMVTALVAFMLTRTVWRQSALIEVESAEVQRQQGQWLLMGAMDWARLILREDARSGEADHLSEPWAVPLQEGRLSSFLSAQPGSNSTTPDLAFADQVFLSGVIEDAQGKFNLSNVLNNQDIHLVGKNQLARLFGLLGLPESLAERLALGMRQSRGPQAELIAPQTIDDLAAWGLDTATLERLRPYLTILPERTILNLNTASPEVLAACVQGLDLSQAQRLVQLRQRSPWTQVTQAQQAFGSAYDSNLHGIGSSFFVLSGQLRQGSTTLTSSALVKRDGSMVNYIWLRPVLATSRP